MRIENFNYGFQMSHGYIVVKASISLEYTVPMQSPRLGMFRMTRWAFSCIDCWCKIQVMTLLERFVQVIEGECPV